MLSQHFKHDWHDEHEGEAAALPHKVECERAHNREELVHVIDTLEQHVVVVLDQLLLRFETSLAGLLLASHLSATEKEGVSDIKVSRWEFSLMSFHSRSFERVSAGM